MANPTDIVDTTEGGRLTSSESTTLDTITVGKVPKKTATGFEDSDPYDPAAVAIEGGTIGGITVGVPNASGYVGASTTTAASAAGGSTAITLTADIGLAAGQGVLICGAGAVMSEGTCYEGTVVSCVGTALVVTPATTTTIPANYAVQRDNRTKTVGTTAPGTAVTLAADIQLLAGQGVFIAGAGAAGANYIGTVASCTGTALVVTPATSTSVSAGARVQHDDTAAIQASLDSLALTGGTILLPPGFYRCNRLTNMPGAGLAPLWLPQTQNPLSIEIVGSIPPAGLEGSPTPQWTGGASMIQSDCTGLAILGGYFGNNNLPWGPWTLVWLSLKNMMFRAYDDPNIGCLYGTWIGSVALDNVYCDTGAWLNNYTYPQTHAVTGVSMPGANCTPSQHIRSLFVSGYPLGLSAGEHTHIDYGFFFHCNTCFSVDSVSAFSADQIIVDVAGIAMLGVHGHVAIDSLRVDQCPTIISDAATGCTGYVNYVSGSGTILGGEQLQITNLDENIFTPTGGVRVKATNVGLAQLVFTPAYLTGKNNATAVVATWQAVSNGSFAITINGSARTISGLNFSTDTTMALVASRIQAAIRVATGALETCVWSTDHFVVSSVLTTSASAITVTSATGAGTDISGAGGTAFMSANTGNGTATARATGTFTVYPWVHYILQVSATATDPVWILLPLVNPVGDGQPLASSGSVFVVSDSGYNAAANNITLVRRGNTKINNVSGNYTMSTSGGSVAILANSATNNWELA